MTTVETPTYAEARVAELEAIDREMRARMAGPLAALRAIPDPTPPVLEYDRLGGANEAKFTRVHQGDLGLMSGTTTQDVLVKGRILGNNARDIKLRNVKATGGPKPPTDVPRPVIDGQSSTSEGWVLEGITVEPEVRSVMWSEGVRVGRLASIKRLLVRGTVDMLAVVTPTGKRTNFDLEDFLFEDEFYSTKDPNHADGTHNDGIQFHGPMVGVKMRRGTIRLRSTATSGVMANVPVAEDIHISEFEVSGARSSFNFGPTPKGSNIAIVDSRLSCPVDVYCTDTLAAVLRLDRSTRADGTPARRNRS